MLRSRRIPEPGAAWRPTPFVGLSIGLHAAAAAAALAMPARWPWLLGGVVADHCLMGAAGLWPRSRLLGPNLVRLDAASIRRGEIALTFDDGPDPLVTPAVLDLLAARGARASFFCIGRRAAAHPALLREIARRGHGVENHSDTHPHAFAAHGPRALHRELATAQRRIADIIGRPPRYFRAPMGLRSPLLDPVLARLGLGLVSWSRRALDGTRGDAAAGLHRLASGLAAGDILLLHDGNAARTRTGRAAVLEILPALLDRMAMAGLRSVPLSAPSSAATCPAGQQQRQPE